MGRCWIIGVLLAIYHFSGLGLGFSDSLIVELIDFVLGLGLFDSLVLGFCCFELGWFDFIE